MGQDCYALLRVGWKRIPAHIRAMLDGADHVEPYLVKNVRLPAVLLCTGINYNALADESHVDELVETVLATFPRELLAAHDDSRGLLLFADGGEPRNCWERRVSYDELIATSTENGKAIPRFSRWVKIPEDRLSETVETVATDAFLMDLDPMTLFRILDAKTKKDFPLLRKLLEDAWKNEDETRAALVEQWLADLGRRD